MSIYRFDESVASDLEAIWDYIAVDDIDAADRWIERLFSAFESLARNPGMEHARRDLTHYAVLFWPIGPYLVIYRAIGDGIEIVAVTQGSRDVPSFLTARVDRP
jgi:plasmid stabilization system protein ParE